MLRFFKAWFESQTWAGPNAITAMGNVVQVLPSSFVLITFNAMKI